MLSFLSLVARLSAEYQPEAYHESNIGQFKHAVKELYKLKLVGTEKILDIGSGDGRVSCYIAKECIPNGRLTGIDKSADMVSFASSQKTALNVSYLCADALEYIVPNEYDAIVSFWTLHWVSDYTRALENIAQSLKPRGKALLCHIVGMSPLQPIVDKLLDTAAWNAYKHDFKSMQPPSLLQVVDAIEKSGLSIESLEVKKNGEWMPIETKKKNLLSLPLFDFIPQNLREFFCDQVLQEFILEYPLNEQKEIFYWVPVVVMVLEKKL